MAELICMAERKYRGLNLPSDVIERVERIREKLPQLGFRSNAALVVRAIDEYLTGLEVKYGVTPRASKAAVEA